MPDSFFSYARLADPLLRGLRRAIFEISGFKAGQSILDVASGTGAQAFEYARRGLRVTGLDMDPNMLKQTEYYSARFPDLKVHFFKGEANRMPFEDGAFDGASISLALHENDPAAQDTIIREMRRVVKPGGNLMLADLEAPLPKTPLGYAIRLIEYAAGAENRSTFRAYQREGGLRGILNRNALKATREARAAAGTVKLMAVSNAKS